MEVFYEFSKSAITYNGVCLDKEVEGYSTLNVIGRQMFSPKLELQNIKGRDGDVISYFSYPARDIEVQYLLKSDSNREWLEQMKYLTMLLQSNKDVEFSFADEYGFRFGRLADYDNPPYDSNTGIGKFTIHCQDPFLYSEQKENVNKINELRYDYYPIKIESIYFSINVQSKKLVLKNETSGNRIIVNTEFNVGDKIEISDSIIRKNNKNILSFLDYVESDFFDFKLYSLDDISCNIADDVIIRYREKVL